MVRTAGTWILFACVGATGLFAALSSTRPVRLHADSPFATLVWKGFDPLRDDVAARPGLDGQARLRLGGFAPYAAMELKLLVSTRAPRHVFFEAPVEVRGGNLAGTTPATVTATAIANGSGVVDFTFGAGPDEFDPAALRVHEIDARAVGSAANLRAVAMCCGLISIGGALLAFLFGARRGLVAGGVLLAAAIISILFNRLVAFPFLGLAFLGLILGALTKGLAVLFVRRFDAPPMYARLLAGGIVLKIAFLVAYTGGDFDFHIHNIGRWRSGAVLTSTAPGLERPLPVPYPPALYAVLATFGNDALALKVALALFELSAPLLVLALARSAGADSRVAIVAAAAMSALPEGLIVLAKGIAANMAGQFATIVAMMFLVRRSTVGFALALAAVFLSHLGATLAILPFLALWPFFDPRMRAERDARIQYALGIAVAAVIAWWGYYSSVLPLLGGAVAQSSSVGGAGWGFHPIRMGKILQGLVLESALLPLLAVMAWRRGHSVVRAWFAVAVGLGLLAMFSPFLLRFEYFGAPAVALLAAEAGSRGEGRGRWLDRLLVAALVLQAALALGFYSGVFPVINVILESPRWPLFVIP